MKKKYGLNDAEKIIVTVALWIASVSVFATALTLYMLPQDVSIFYRQADGYNAEHYSKYYNLLLLCVAVVPLVIITIITALKRRGRLQNNFLSMVLFSMMLSLCIASVIIYGIIWQFAASKRVRGWNINAFICMLASFLPSLLFSVLPSVRHMPNRDDAQRPHGSVADKLYAVAVEDWYLFVHWFLLTAIACAFLPSYYSYIPFGVSVAAFAVYLTVRVNKYRPSEENN